jgi:hypothetical protein
MVIRIIMPTATTSRANRERPSERRIELLHMGAGRDRPNIVNSAWLVGNRVLVAPRAVAPPDADERHLCHPKVVYLQRRRTALQMQVTDVTCQLRK